MSSYVTEHIVTWQKAEMIDQEVINRFPDHATQADMDQVVAVIAKIKGMTTQDMIQSLEKHDLHPSGSAARVIVGGLLGDLVLARDMGLVYSGLKVKGERTVNEVLGAQTRLNETGSAEVNEFQREYK